MKRVDVPLEGHTEIISKWTAGATWVPRVERIGHLRSGPYEDDAIRVYVDYDERPELRDIHRRVREGAPFFVETALSAVVPERRTLLSPFVRVDLMFAFPFATHVALLFDVAGCYGPLEQLARSEVERMPGLHGGALAISPLGVHWRTMADSILIPVFPLRDFGSFMREQYEWFEQTGREYLSFHKDKRLPHTHTPWPRRRAGR